jgi:CHRD domain-containing protein
MKKALIALLALVVAAAVAVPALGRSNHGNNGRHGSKPVHRTLTAALAGADELNAQTLQPGAGDPDGVGAALVVIHGRNVCFRIIARRIGDATAAHIHRGTAAQNGPIVVPFFDDPVGNGNFTRRQGCVKASSRALTKEIARNPGNFYVNVHTTDFPGGAIRGQLSG